MKTTNMLVRFGTYLEKSKYLFSLPVENSYKIKNEKVVFRLWVV